MRIFTCRASPEERARHMPADSIVPEAVGTVTNAVTTRYWPGPARARAADRARAGARLVLLARRPVEPGPARLGGWPHLHRACLQPNGENTAVHPLAVRGCRPSPYAGEATARYQAPRGGDAAVRRCMTKHMDHLTHWFAFDRPLDFGGKRMRPAHETE